jgi:hypothetical protein
MDKKALMLQVAEQDLTNVLKSQNYSNQLSPLRNRCKTVPMIADDIGWTEE